MDKHVHPCTHTHNHTTHAHKSVTHLNGWATGSPSISDISVMFIICYGSQPIETWLPQSQQCPPHRVPPSLSTGKLLHHREADGYEYVSSCSPKHQWLWINKQNNNIAVQHSACTHCKLVVVQGHLCADRDVTDPAFFSPTPDMTTTGLSCLLVETDEKQWPEKQMSKTSS